MIMYMCTCTLVHVHMYILCVNPLIITCHFNQRHVNMTDKNV